MDFIHEQWTTWTCIWNSNHITCIIAFQISTAGLKCWKFLFNIKRWWLIQSFQEHPNISRKQILLPLHEYTLSNKNDLLVLRIETVVGQGWILKHNVGLGFHGRRWCINYYLSGFEAVIYCSFFSLMFHLRLRSQSSEDARHRRRRNIRENKEQ